MVFRSTYEEDFFEAGLQIIQQNGELLVFIHYSTGLSCYFIIRNREELIELLTTRKKRESIFFFKSFRVLVRGVISSELDKEIASTLVRPQGTDWVLIFEQESWKDTDDYFAMDIPEVFERITDATEVTDKIKDKKIFKLTIIDEPDWLNKDLRHQAYVPNEDGVIQPGIY